MRAPLANGIAIRPTREKRRVVGAAVGELEGEGAGCGGGAGSTVDLEAEARVVLEMAGLEGGARVGRDRGLRVLAVEQLADWARQWASAIAGSEAAIARTSAYSAAIRRRQSASQARSVADPSPWLQALSEAASTIA